ncbi:uncharacterized protein LOC126562326 [Anopheles maculipalpis]|uniref:uncharacterized protein LOC126562326 n=1 Tax=Anopheles maculipalpis TaxID=1496333 RepID=UPI0021598A85|nr:uncharacterized protein LOC126562326 [Anopheles maculipalpis]
MSEQSDESKEMLGEYDRNLLEQLVVNDWGLSAAAYKRMVYCGIDEVSLVLIEDSEINELFSDARLLGQKILFKHRLRQWRQDQQSFLSNIAAHIALPNGNGNGTSTPGTVAPRQLHPALNGTAPTYKRKYPFDLDHSATQSALLQQQQHQHPQSDDDVVSIKTDHDTQQPATMNGHGLKRRSTTDRDSPLIMPPTYTAASLSLIQPLVKRKIEPPTLKERTSGAIGDIPVRIDRDSMLRLLQSSQSGRWILSSFKPNEPLERRGQTIITHLIVDQFLHFNILFKHRMMSHYADVITQVFPAELKEIYYAPRNTVKRNTSGKLFDRYTNQRLRHKERLPRVKPFVADEWTEHKTFAELAILNEAMQGVHSAVTMNGDDATGSEDGNISNDFLQPLATMYVEGEDHPVTSGGVDSGAVDYSTREDD